MKTTLSASLAICTLSLLAAPVELRLTGDWTIQVTYGEKSGIVRVAPANTYQVENERHATLQDFNPNAGGWCCGTRLSGIIAHECTTRHAYRPGTLKVKSSADADALVYEEGKDYKLMEDWGTVGRLPESRIGTKQEVYFDYTYAKFRIDALVLDSAGLFALRQGVPHQANPAPAALQEGDVRLANIWLNGDISRLTEDNLFPILENEFPAELKLAPGRGAKDLLPKTYAKLQRGETVQILAWGDSVTVGSFLSTYPEGRWQERITAWLKERFPKADIQLTTLAWGGRNTSSFLDEPSGSDFNYEEKVLAPKPDLIISEFVNDAGFSREFTFERYGKFLKDFQERDIEWIILTPHYVLPDWMGFTSIKNIDQDPRVYVTALREFAEKNHVALADASLRWGRLWRQGIPYICLMVNGINHPNEFGMNPFVESLQEIFQE